MFEHPPSVERLIDEANVKIEKMKEIFEEVTGQNKTEVKNA